MEAIQTNKHTITIGNFNGPLDLLCFLISKNKMDIFEISLSELTDQYLQYIYELQALDMEIATEFLVMASTLVYIKSKRLLPMSEQPEEESVEQTEQELLRRIAEYKLYKEKQELFRQMYDENFGSFTKMPEKINIKNKCSVTVVPQLLYTLAKEVVYRNNRAKNVEAERVEKIAVYDKVTVKSKVQEIIQVFKQKASFVFSSLFKNKTSKLDIVTSFLGVLELSKLNQVKIKQDEMYGDILVTKNKEFDIHALDVSE